MAGKIEKKLLGMPYTEQGASGGGWVDLGGAAAATRDNY
jgi:hypothetical protein